MITACACDIAQQVAKCEPWTSTGVMSWQLLGKNSLCGLQERCRESGAARTAQGKHTMAPRCFQGSAATHPKFWPWEKVMHVQGLLWHRNNFPLLHVSSLMMWQL